MVKLIVDEKYNGKKLDRFLLDKFNNLSFNEFHKALRKKDIKVNGKRVNQNISLFCNDEICIYIVDEILYGKRLELEIVYEDDNILVINKPINITVQKENNEICVMDLVNNYYKQKNLKIIAKPCHRLDRNTSGLLVIAKNSETEKILLEKFKNREIKKYYLATVYGIPKTKSQTLNAFLFKDAKKNIVYISDVKKTGYLPITTKYTVLEENKKDNTSVLEVELITGRTHQIRAHLSYIGFPIIGDGKYGNNKINKAFKKSSQMLHSYKLVFDFKTPSFHLDYLNKKVLSSASAVISTITE